MVGGRRGGEGGGCGVVSGVAGGRVEAGLEERPDKVEERGTKRKDDARHSKRPLRLYVPSLEQEVLDVGRERKVRRHHHCGRRKGRR